MFTPQILIAAVLAVLAAFLGGFFAGQDWADTKHEADRAEALALHQEAMEHEIRQNNVLSARLAEAENRITIKTTEVIKHVPKVTTGRPCLGPAAVGLLQPGQSAGLRPPAGEPAAESPAASATDTDIAYWIADANRYYDTCAERLNLLVDRENPEDPEEK